VRHQFARCFGFLQGVGQHGQAVQIQLATGDMPFIVGGAGQGDDGGGAMGSGQGDGEEGVAEDVPEKLRLLTYFRTFASILTDKHLSGRNDVLPHGTRGECHESGLDGLRTDDRAGVAICSLPVGIACQAIRIKFGGSNGLP
jgi:hypothetical protein